MNTEHNHAQYNPLDIEQMEQILAETEALSHALREDIRLQRQHEAIDDLPHLLDTVEQGKWSNLKLLMEELLQDRRAKRAKKEAQ
ncbi:hypothetical protein [Corynebacterium cystitidis]|uniref:Uncharacterized protein n=1 Tax=Corynebacterium cystitidis DSM 20524 TaxID=1121357 RepID=A0A1H9VC25_9CORY|nr:hypothetical protein [Corynebacterium cystitidis]WJY82303.1 hypothetical protein CCYS_06870 [Corynebacterium cystitidis DSM 20524]SES19129.1 hypothetical protein SAMN05661109_02168 [Corynebacterium cystitidis DSM 20524]SNV76648.1 Uncharacterised protein [Corynebacterium cystitidis]